MWFRPIFQTIVKTTPIIHNPLKNIAIRNLTSLTTSTGMLSNYQLHNLVQMLVSRETENCGLS